MKQERLGDEFIDFEVSTGTLHDTHLLVAYHNFLVEHYPDYENSGTCEEAEALISITNLVENLGEYEEYASISHIGKNVIALYINETLPDMINELAPKGYYFGSHIGSSADVGFWSVELLDEF